MSQIQKAFATTSFSYSLWKFTFDGQCKVDTTEEYWLAHSHIHVQGNKKYTVCPRRLSCYCFCCLSFLLYELTFSLNIKWNDMDMDMDMIMYMNSIRLSIPHLFLSFFLFFFYVSSKHYEFQAQFFISLHWPVFWRLKVGIFDGNRDKNSTEFSKQIEMALPEFEEDWQITFHFGTAN